MKKKTTYILDGCQGVVTTCALMISDECCSNVHSGVC